MQKHDIPVSFSSKYGIKTPPEAVLVVPPEQQKPNMSTTFLKTASESSVVMNNNFSNQNTTKYDINYDSKINAVPVSFSSKHGIDVHARTTKANDNTQSHIMPPQKPVNISDIKSLVPVGIQSLSANEAHFPEGDITIGLRCENPEDLRSISAVGWAMARYSNNPRPLQNGDVKSKKYCLGIFKCTMIGCKTVVRPHHPKKITKFKAPTLGPHQRCPAHGQLFMKHIFCGATMTVIRNNTTKNVTLIHTGHHPHEQPPSPKVPVMVQQRINTCVAVNPSLTPLNLETGTPGLDPVTRDCKELFHKDKLKDHVSNAKKKIRGIESVLELRDWQKEMGKQYIAHTSFDESGCLTLQTDFMKRMAKENKSGFETDACESALKIHELPNAVVQMTVGFNEMLNGFMPYVVSIMYDKTHESYNNHFATLLASLVHISLL